MKKENILKRQWNLQKRKFYLQHNKITKYQIHKTNTNYQEKLRCGKCGKTISANINSRETPYKLSDEIPECKKEKQKIKS